MKIADAFPPNIEKIEAALGRRRAVGTLFCYGYTIYAPGAGTIPPQLIAHEKIHSERQIKIGVDVWWDLYLTDKGFRYDEELLAHIAECEAISDDWDRRARRKYAAAAAKRLSGPLYGRLVSYETARLALRGAVRHPRAPVTQKIAA